MGVGVFVGAGVLVAVAVGVGVTVDVGVSVGIAVGVAGLVAVIVGIAVQEVPVAVATTVIGVTNPSVELLQPVMSKRPRATIQKRLTIPPWGSLDSSMRSSSVIRFSTPIRHVYLYFGSHPFQILHQANRIDNVSHHRKPWLGNAAIPVLGDARHYRQSRKLIPIVVFGDDPGSHRFPFLVSFRL